MAAKVLAAESAAAVAEVATPAAASVGAVAVAAVAGACLPINPATHFVGDHDEESAEALLVFIVAGLSIIRLW